MTKRSALALLVAMTALGPATPAGAQEPELRQEEVAYESPQRFWAEFKLGPYIPGIDGEFGGRATPFKDIFGDGKSLIFTWELDYEIPWRKIGTFAVGGSFGYYTNSTKALNETGTARSGSDTQLQIFPMALLAIYRFDVAADRWKIPLVPYVKVGINYTFWWMLLDGDTATFSGADGTKRDGRGGTFGWQLNAGMALRLDFIEQAAARTLDAELGINHTYLFFELDYVAANGLGASSALGLGDTTWSGGLAFEF